MSRRPFLIAGTTALLLLLLTPACAWADITAFFGMATTDGRRSARGVSLGLSLLVVGFEIEYANISESEQHATPSMKTTTFNGVLQTPTGRAQVYFSAGGGYYNQHYRDLEASGFGTNLGGGIKIGLAGPIRLRVDYRVFTQKGEPFQKTTQRFYGGINLSF